MVDASETFEIESKSTSQLLRVTVKPGGPGSPGLYVLDPSFFFGAAVGISSLLHRAALLTGGSFPALTVVGVGYATEDPEEVFVLRARDLTPTDGKATTSMQLPPLRFGGAERFLDALAGEIIPEVEARFDVDPARGCLSGFSFGGLFGLYVLFHRPETFSRYLMGSPSLWWDEGLAFAWEETWAAGHEDVEARVFLCVGANEQLVGDTWKNEGIPLETLTKLAQVDRLSELGRRLGGRDYPSLGLDTVVLHDEYHFTAPPAAITRGLLTLFEGY